MRKLQAAEEEVADFEEYSHGSKNIKGMEAKNMATTIKSPYEGQMQQKEEMDVEIDELWKLMMKNSIWKYHWMRRTINQKLKLAERDYINKVK
jgi:hypothetical protein